MTGYPDPITGVILAGGLATRMSGQDKGLTQFNGRALVSYAISALQPVAKDIIVNANRNIDQYRHFGLPVIADDACTFDGPLSGVLAAMNHSLAQVLLVLPCDCPLIKTEHVKKLLAVLYRSQADIAIAFDGNRLHNVFFATRTSLKNDLQHYLVNGHRKVATWQQRHAWVRADFSQQPEIFANINTMNELIRLETLQNAQDIK